MENIRGKAYESMVARRDVNYSEVERALPIVEDFILKHGLCLYGGQALDFAFQLKGSFVYDPQDDVIPDLDFYSPDPIHHSYELADILHKKGFEKVNAINALHVTTMRVRIGSDVVADISYVPPNIFKVLPMLKFTKGKKTFNIINPLFQRIDLHESLTEPFRDPPHEVIFHRFKKDIKRFKMLEEMYPVPPIGKFKKPDNIKMVLPNLSNVLFVGYVSYAIHYLQLQELIDSKKSFDKFRDKFMEIEPLKIWVENQAIHLEIPRTEPIAIYTDDYEHAVYVLTLSNKDLKPKYYNTYLDRSRPRMVKLANLYEIFDNRRSIKTYVPVTLKPPTGVKNPKGKSVEIKGASLHLTAMYFLQRYFEQQHDFYLHFYDSTLKIAKLTEEILGTLPEKEQTKQMDKLSMFICKNWFGEYNLGDAFSIQMQYLVANNQGERLENMRARSYRPDEHDKHPPHDVKKMPPYQIDGLETEPFEPVGTGWYDQIEIRA